MSFKDFLIRFSWLFIPAATVAPASWITDFIVDKDPSIYYNYIYKNVGELSSLYIELDNSNSYTVDDVIIRTPDKNIMSYSYDPTSKRNQENFWAGSLKSGSKIKILYVSKNEIPTSVDYINKIVEAKYQKRNSESGDLEWKNIEIKNGVNLYKHKLLITIIIYLSLFALLGLIVWFASKKFPEIIPFEKSN